MIPSTTGFLDLDFTIKEQPSKTYKMDLDTETSIKGYTDGIEAMKQVVYKILNTERYQYVIYSWDYGIETLDLYGEPITWICPELERRITEALLTDTRITDVTDFEFDISEKHVIGVTFTVHTIFGDMGAEKVVNF